MYYFQKRDRGTPRETAYDKKGQNEKNRDRNREIQINLEKERHN